MILREPAYFEKFRCIAAACPDSCCQEWDVAVDDETADRYLVWPGPLGDALQQAMYQDEGWYFRNRENRCPFWQTDGLCRIQAEAGHEALCHTCREFPRLRHDYGNFWEQGLSLSCPEAARLILSQEESHWLQREIPGGEEPEYDPQDMDILLETREKMLGLLSDTTRPVQEVLALGLLYGYQAQALLDGEELEEFDAESQLSFGISMAKKSDFMEFVDFYKNLEILTDTWRKRLESPAPGAWDTRLRAMARYGVERYWLQAISDFDLVGRTKLVIAGCILVRLLGGELTETAQLYAKEIENDLENVEAILEGAYSAPALTDEKLLGLLLGA